MKHTCLVVFYLLVFSGQFLIGSEEENSVNFWDRMNHFEMPLNPSAFLTKDLRAIYELEIGTDGSVASVCSQEEKIRIIEKLIEPHLLKWSFLPSSSEQIRFYSLHLILHAREQSENPTGHYIEIESPNKLHFHYNESTLLRMDRIDGKVPKANCRKHRCEMNIEIIPLASGFWSEKVEPFLSPRSKMRRRLKRAKKRLFPNCPSLVRLNYCGLTEKKAEAFICLICKRNKVHWLSENPDIKCEFPYLIY